jgi:hypothetical protein
MLVAERWLIEYLTAPGGAMSMTSRAQRGWNTPPIN